MYQDISIKNKTYLIEPPISKTDNIYIQLKKEANHLSKKFTPPTSLADWNNKKKFIYNEIIKKAGIEFYKNIPIKINISKILETKNYTIQNIYFNTLPNVYATANLYIPKGEGPFPAVINLHGHIKDGRLDSTIQNRAHLLASNGFVCLCMDTFGSGERSEIHGESDYHGSNKGTALFNINKTLLGIQITENIRCIDLLTSLHFVDSNNIGVTGESGGGNQAMWLAAIDERIKAVVPVVSVGTFEAFVMEHNCICELLPDGLTFCEEFQVLGLIAPRALNIFNALQETHAAFSAHEMVKTASNAGKIYKLYNSDSFFQVQIFNNAHEYSLDMQKAMLIWFNQHLKKSTNKLQLEISEKCFSESDLSVFAKGKRVSEIITQSKFLEIESNLLQQNNLSQTFNPEEKREKLKEILNINTVALTENFQNRSEKYSSMKYQKNICIEWTCNDISTLNKNNKTKRIDNNSMIQMDLYGFGENKSSIADYFDGQMIAYHTLFRSLCWIGRTLIGEWVMQMVAELDTIIKINSFADIELTGRKEAGLAILFLSAIHPNKIKTIELDDIPISYLFKANQNFDYYNMSIHLKGILNWGNIVTAAALSNAKIIIRNPKNIHGNIITESEKKEFKESHTILSKRYKTNSKLIIN
ncbi:alpha/beta hydrolase family protein [Hydrotalea sp.]|uniref:alpha/beta hydrolase family protein n=1 Tax=Hydrotalea sp. TaxID=2881279 RepID=UPI003D144C81